MAQALCCPRGLVPSLLSKLCGFGHHHPRAAHVAHSDQGRGPDGADFLSAVGRPLVLAALAVFPQATCGDTRPCCVSPAGS